MREPWQGESDEQPDHTPDPDLAGVGGESESKNPPRYCAFCGTKRPPKAKFCVKCERQVAD
jgi:hypothetical protein